jgi:hypothetical protein
MNKLVIISLALLSVNVFAKPKYGPKAIVLSLSHEYFRENKANDFFALMPYYTTQFNGKACSVASISMIINATRNKESLTSDDKLVNQEDLLKKVNDKLWSDAVNMSKPGGGVALDDLKAKVEESFKAYGIKNFKVEVNHMEDTASSRDHLHKLLVENEKSSKDFILANFIQGSFTGDSDIGHISPVGAYDAKRKRVLILDIDHEWYEPYWVSEETFASGMATVDKQANHARGYLYIKIEK